MTIASQRPWAGSDDDVAALLQTHLILGEHLVRAYVTARGRGDDAVRAMFDAHNDLPWIVGSRAHEFAITVCRQCDEAVAYLRARGENLLGAAGR